MADGQSLALADEVLKEAYEGDAVEACNNANVIAAVVTKNTRDFEGREAVLALHVGRNTGIGARLENEVLPQAGAQAYKNEKIPCRNQYGKISLSGNALDRLHAGRGSFINGLTAEMDGLKTDQAQDMARQYWGTSDGVIVTCGTTTAVNVVVLASTTTFQQLVKFAEQSYRVDIGTVADPQLIAANRKVTAVDFSAKTITIDGAAVTTSSSHFVFRQGAGGSGANQRESTGLQTIIDDAGTLFNVDPNVTFQWKSTVDGNSGTERPISEPLIVKTQMKARNLSGKDADLLIAEDGVFIAISAMISGRQRIVNDRALKGGFTGIEFAAAGRSVAITADKDAPPHKLWGICTPDLVEYVETEWGWMNRDGSILKIRTDGTDGYYANWYSRRELTCKRRNSHWVIEDLADA